MQIQQADDKLGKIKGLEKYVTVIGSAYQHHQLTGCQCCENTGKFGLQRYFFLHLSNNVLGQHVARHGMLRVWYSNVVGHHA